MLDLKFIREFPELVRKNIENKNEKPVIDEILAIDETRRGIIQEAEKLKSLRNTVSAEIAVLKKEKQDADDKIREMKEVSDRIKQYDEDLRAEEEKLEALVVRIPNMTHESVPVGRDAEDNIEIHRFGEFRDQKLSINHIDICKKLGIIDFERATKLSGSGFAFYVGKGAALERAIINFMLDTHIEKHGYTEMLPPLIVGKGAMHGTGQLPKMEEDMYFAEKDGLYLIPTAEVPLTNFYSGEMLSVEDLPIKITGYTPCFRREAGSYGKDTRGLLRVHQFNKVEMVKFARPENSYEELEALTSDAEDILKAFDIPCRRILLCTGDTSFSSAKTYDLEAWSPAENKWLEVSSCSNFESFQARRANIRFRPAPNAKPEFVHTLNGSGVATSRLMVAILEYYVQENGTVKVPECLREYCRFDTIG